MDEQIFQFLIRNRYAILILVILLLAFLIGVGSGALGRGEESTFDSGRVKAESAPLSASIFLLDKAY
jgi:hypothetical protein